MYKQPSQVSVVYTTDKDGQMLVMCDMALSFLLKIRAYAKAINNKALLYAINYADKELRSGSELQIIKRCQTIYNKAKEHLADLAPYDITSNELAQFQKAIGDVKPLITQRNAIASQRISSTFNTPLLIAEAQAELDKVDELIKSTVFDKTFIKAYMQVRKHIETGLTAEINGMKHFQAL
jgi:hypothetical protein